VTNTAGKRSKRREPDQLRPAGEILGTVLASLGLDGYLREREVLEAWPLVVGEEIARRSQALRIRDGILTVRVDSAAWCQELHFLKDDMLARLAERLGPGRVREIRFSQH